MKPLINAFKVYVSLFMFASAVFAKTGPQPNNLYTEQNQDILITTKQPEFTLKLKSNPTTGYSWFLREYDADILTPTKHEFVAPQNKKLMGAPGYELWSFRVKNAAFAVPQQTVIRMIYIRPWQSQDAATQVVFRVSTGK